MARSTPKALYLVVTTSEASDTFELSVQFGPAPSEPEGDTCDAPVEVVFVDGLADFPTESMAGHVNNWSAGVGDCDRLDGPDKFYSVTIPPQQRLIVELQVVMGEVSDGSIGLVGGAEVCVPANATCEWTDYFIGGMQLQRVFNNTTTQPVQKTLIVDQTADPNYPGYAPLEYALRFMLSVPPADDVCTGATPIADGQTLTGQTTVGYVSDYAGQRCHLLGNDRVYTLTVPAGQQVTLVATPTSGTDLTLDLVFDNGSPTLCDGVLPCVSGSDHAGDGGAETASRSNRGATDEDYLLFVGSRGVPGDFDLSMTLNAAPTPPAGDFCDNALVLTVPAGGLTRNDLTLEGLEANYQSHSSGGCLDADSTAGSDMVLAFDVPPGERLVVSVDSLAGSNPSVQLLMGDDPTVCDATSWTCLDATDTPNADTVTWPNDGVAVQRVFAIVDTSDVDGGPFVLDASLNLAPEGETCETAVQVTLPATLSNQSTLTAANDYGTTMATVCTRYGTAGHDLVYAVDLPSQNKLTITVTPLDPEFDPALYIVNPPAANCGLAPPACQQGLSCTSIDNLPLQGCGYDEGAKGVADGLIVFNSTNASMPLYVVVDTYAADAGGPFDLSFVLTTL